MMEPINFEKWVNENNPDTSLSYGKGWWDHVEDIRRLAERIEALHIAVISTYIMVTPPPQEELCMPITSLCAKHCRFILKENFGSPFPYWVISVENPHGRQIEHLEVFLTSEHVTQKHLVGFHKAWIYPSYQESSQKFTCLVDTIWDVYGVLKFIVTTT